MESSENSRIPRFMTINEIAKTGILPKHCIRQMMRDGTLPTRIIKSGNKSLLNFDLLIENLKREE